jgi:SRSO17 transposase
MGLGEDQDLMQDDKNWRSMINDWVREQQARALRFGPKPEKPLDRRRKLPPEAITVAPIVPQPEMRAYLQRFRAVFGRSDTLRNAEIYLRGLCSDLPRKNGETMEAAIPGARQMDIFNFLVRSNWSAQALDERRVLDWVSEFALGGAGVHVVIDETSQLKQGKLSVGVARQYLGCVGKVANGQVMVSLHGIWDEHELPLTGELYLPKSWTDQPKRTAAAKVPEGVGFRTKPAIAAELLQRVRTWGLPLAMVHADAGYGDLGFMQHMAEQSLPYCIGVRGNFTVYLPGEALIAAQPAPPYQGKGRPPKGQPEKWPLHSVEDVRAVLPVSCWQTVSYRQDSKGAPLQRQFAALRVQPATTDVRGPEQWLLLERPLEPESTDLKQYLISLPATTSLAEMAELAHLRAQIERESYENAKQAVGLTDYQGRSWPGYHRHLAMAWLALTWLQRQRQPLEPPAQPLTASATMAAATAAVITPEPASSPPALQFAGEPIPIRLAEVTTAPRRPLPRTHRESLQAVHRRLSQWHRIAVVRQWMLLGRCPALPLLQPALAP